MDESGTRGQTVIVWGWTDDPTISPDVIRYVSTVLRRLGYRAHVYLVAHAALRHPPPSVVRGIQLIAAGWGDTPYGFVATFFACNGTSAHRWFCDPRIDRMNARARSLQETDPHAAAALWAAIDAHRTKKAA